MHRHIVLAFALSLTAVAFTSVSADAQRQCVRGKPCGNTCIAMDRVCRVEQGSATWGQAPPPRTPVASRTPLEDSIARMPAPLGSGGNPCLHPTYVAMRRVDVGLMTVAEYEAFHLREYACQQYIQTQQTRTAVLQRFEADAPVAQPMTPLAYRKDPAAATLFSLPLAGAGHLYTGETGTGATLLGLYTLGQIVGYAGLLAAAANDDSDAALWVSLGGFTVSGISWLYGVFDARPSARRMNRRNGYPEPGIRR